MNKKYLHKNIIIFIISILIIVLNSINVIAAPFLFTYPAGKENAETVILMGDSYAGYFSRFESGRDYNILIYANAGCSVKDNYDIMKEAAGFEPSKVIISIGVNDNNKNNPPEDFEKIINEVISICKKNNKIVILHTYMDYDLKAIDNKHLLYDVSQYDEILKNIAKKNSNVMYINMSDYNNEVYLQEDRIHYNKVFYDELYNRISTAFLLLS